MSRRLCIAVGSLSAALAVGLGAFGAHALRDRLAASDQAANWDTAVHYQMWHALALILVGVMCERRSGLAFPAWAFVIGSLLFSGSIYCLALDFQRPVMGPITPIGGSFLIAGWVALAFGAWKRASEA